LAGFLARIKSRLFFDRYSLVQFFRQSSTLTKAGFGVIRGLEICLQQTSEPRLINALENTIILVGKGHSYSDALAKSPDIFTNFQVNMIRAAEASGKLPEALDSLAYYEEKEMRLRLSLKAATSYPIFVFIFSIFCIILLMRFLTPLLDTITGVLEGEIPFPTLILITIANAVSHPIFYVAMILFFIAIRYIYNYYVGTLRGRLAVDGLKFNLPVFGKLYKKVVLIRVCRVMKTLLNSGVPAVKTMELVGDVSDNFYMKDRIMGGVAFRVKEGSSLKNAFASRGFFPNIMISMIAIGEQTGTLPIVMEKLSDMYEFDVEIAISNFYATLEPLLIMIMGGFTFIILLAAFLPIYQIIGSLGG